MYFTALDKLQLRRKAITAGDNWVGAYSDRLRRRIPREMNKAFSSGANRIHRTQRSTGERAGGEFTRAFLRTINRQLRRSDLKVVDNRQLRRKAITAG